MSASNSMVPRGLIVIAAPSGAGKSSLCNELLRRCAARLSLSISTTSRAPRGNEKSGVEYFFVSQDEFEQKISENRFAEWARVHNHYYGTSKKTIEDFWGAGRHVLLDIDVQGAESLRQAYPDRTLTIFISPPDLQELERRLRGRGTETEEAIALRMKNAKEEMARMGEFDRVILNDDFNRAENELAGVVNAFMDAIEEDQWQRRP